MTLNITDAELHEWARMRADDAGRLARELVACRLQSQAAVAAAYEAAARVVDPSSPAESCTCQACNERKWCAQSIRALATPDQIAALAAERAKLHKAVEAILNARAHHIHCVEAYNEKREFVEKLRVAGNWTHNPHVEYLAMCDAHREFVGIAERFADAVLAEIGGA